MSRQSAASSHGQPPAAFADAHVAGAAALRVLADGSVTLVGARCGDCGVEVVPPVAVCPACAGEAMHEAPQPDTGTLYSFTTLHVGPKRWAKPMTIGYVDLPNGVRVFAHLRGSGIAVGATVKLSHGIVGAEDDGTPIETFIFEAAEDTP